jgi:lipopolysaccharide export system protein LptA
MFSKPISNPGLNKVISVFLLFFASLLMTPAQAIDPRSQAPIEIESDQATLDDKTGISTYSGNVIVSQGLSRLEAEIITVNSVERRIINITALGNPAHFSQQMDPDSPTTHGYGKEITFSAADETLLFKGNARLLQSENSFSGETIEYDVTRKAIKAKGDINEGSRVKIQYFPDNPVKEASRTGNTNPAATDQNQ